MKIKIICVGKLKEKYLKDGIAEYVKRMGRFAKCEIIELPDEKTPDQASPAENNNILAKEGDKICKQIRKPNKHDDPKHSNKKVVFLTNIYEPPS